MSAVGAELSPDAADPGLNLDGVLLAFDEGCRNAVVTIRYAPGGVVVDYGHDRCGRPVVMTDKVRSTLEAFVNIFGWNFNAGVSQYVTHDRVGDFLALLIKHYFLNRLTNEIPLQIAPVAEFMTEQDFVELGSRSLIRKLNLKRAGVGIVEGPAMRSDQRE